MLSNRGIQAHAAGDNLMTLPSSRDPGALSGTLAGISFVGGVAGAMALADSSYPRPGSEPAEIRTYFRGNPGAARLSVVGQLISAASLARFTASVARLAGQSRRGSRGLRAAALADDAHHLVTRTVGSRPRGERLLNLRVEQLFGGDPSLHNPEVDAPEGGRALKRVQRTEGDTGPPTVHRDQQRTDGTPVQRVRLLEELDATHTWYSEVGATSATSSPR